MGDGASAAGRSQAGCRHGALLNPASTLPATRLFRFIKSQPVRDADHPADRSGREQIFYWVSAPNVVPLVVTNRTGKRNRAGRVPVIGWFFAACQGHRLLAKSKGGF
jgi:hypothetical protein